MRKVNVQNDIGTRFKSIGQRVDFIRFLEIKKTESCLYI